MQNTSFQNEIYHIRVDQGWASRMESQIDRIEDTLKHLERVLSDFNKFASYPQWLTKDQAMEILPFETYYLLKKYVDAGVIRAKEISESGRVKAYRKEDCIKFPERLEEYKLGKIVLDKDED